MLTAHSLVCSQSMEGGPSVLLGRGGGGEPPTKFSKRKVGLPGSKFLEGGGGLGGDCRFYMKNKLKSGIFNDKKFINKNLIFLSQLLK